MVLGARADSLSFPPRSVPYAALTATFSKIDATSKRLEISAYLTHFLVEVIQKTPDDLLKSVYLCINRVRPSSSSLGPRSSSSTKQS